MRLLSPSLLICLTTQVGVTKSALFAPSVSRKIHGKNLLNTSTNTHPTRTTRVSNLGWLLLNALGAQCVLPATASVNSTSARGRVGALKPSSSPLQSTPLADSQPEVRPEAACILPEWMEIFA